MSDLLDLSALEVLWWLFLITLEIGWIFIGACELSNCIYTAYKLDQMNRVLEEVEELRSEYCSKDYVIFVNET